MEKNTENKPHYVGHRQRLKEKLLTVGKEGLSDYELMELLLMVAIPRIDVKPLAKELLAKFGSYSNVIYAEPSELVKVKGIKENTVAVFKTVEASVVKTLESDMKEKNIINNWEKLLNYCLANVSNNNIEEFRVLYLNTKFHLIKDEMQQKGTINYAAVYPREIVKKALELNAHSIIMIHNHPSGDATPSMADVDITQKIKKALSPLGIAIHDHIIFAKGGENYSFKENGVL